MVVPEQVESLDVFFLKYFPFYDEKDNILYFTAREGTSLYDDENLSLGFRRLSIIDIKNGQQPMLSKNKNYLICFNGEIYNYKSIQRRLREKGVLLKTSSDTEVLLESFSLWGKESLKIINGMFSFVIYDKSKKKNLFGQRSLWNEAFIL